MHRNPPDVVATHDHLAGVDVDPKVEAEGGSTVQARTEIPNMGAFAYFKDCEGNTLGLWETFG